MAAKPSQKCGRGILPPDGRVGFLPADRGVSVRPASARIVRGPACRRGLLAGLVAFGLCSAAAMPTAAAPNPPEVVPPPAPAGLSPSELSRQVVIIVGQSEPQARVDAAVMILRSSSKEGVRALCDVLESKNNETAKLAVCQAISQAQSTPGEFIAPLMVLLDDKESALREAAAAALAGYHDPVVTARLKEQEQQLLEKRFVATCKQLYGLLATDADRAACLQRWLKSTLALERVTALELIHDKMSTGTRPAPEVLQQIRQMLNDRDERVRQRLVIILRDLRQPEDAARVEALLANERAPEVREEIYRALGYLGDPLAIPTCVTGLSEPSEPVAAQAAGALGRLAACGSSDPPPGTTMAVAALVQRANQPMENAVLREQVIEAMAQIADPAFLPALRIHAGANEKVPAIRQAALRGISQIGGPEDVDIVIDRLINDPDPGVQVFAAEALGKLGNRPEHLELLRERLDPKVEPSAAVQARAWESYRLLFLKVLSPAERDAVLGTWAATDPVSVGRRTDLLADLEKQASAANTDPQRLVRIRELLGDAYLSAGRAADSAQAYARAMEVLAPGDLEGAQRVAGKLLLAHLRTPAPEKAVALLTDSKMRPLRDFLIGDLLDYIRQTAATNRAAAMTLLDKLQQMAPEQLGGQWSSRLQELRAALPLATQPATTQPLGQTER
jgi:HEAT repeat protein